MMMEIDALSLAMHGFNEKF